MSSGVYALVGSSGELDVDLIDGSGMGNGAFQDFLNGQVEAGFPFSAFVIVRSLCGSFWRLSGSLSLESIEPGAVVANNQLEASARRHVGLSKEK